MAYESAKIGGDDYSTYPLDENGKPIPVDMVENGKSFKFVQPAVAKERFVKQFAKNNNMTVQEVKETVFGDQPVGKKYFYFDIIDCYNGKGIFGSFNKEIAKERVYDAKGMEQDDIFDDEADNYQMLDVIGQFLDGKARADGSVYKYIGQKNSKYVYFYNNSTDTSRVETFDGLNRVSIDTECNYSSGEDYETHEECIRRMETKTNELLAKGYKRYDSYNWDEEVEFIKNYIESRNN